MNFMTHFFNLVECFDIKPNEGAINGRLVANDPNQKVQAVGF